MTRGSFARAAGAIALAALVIRVAYVLALGSHPSLGFELAACGRLVKGYGATNERGKANLLHVIDHLASAANFATDTQRADAVRQARVAALADEAGTALDQTLLRHGAPPRPVQAQPIRWVGARPGRPEARAGAHDAGA